MKPALYLFVALAAAGLILSLVAHASALLGRPLGSAPMNLHIGVFIVGLPPLLVAQRRRDFWQMSFWRALFRACPTWMRAMTIAFFVYAPINFALFYASGAPGGILEPRENIAVLRGYSGHWMALYAAILAILYSATKLDAIDSGCEQRRSQE